MRPDKRSRPAGNHEAASSGLGGQALDPSIAAATPSAGDAARMSKAAAERLSADIRRRLDTIADNAEQVVPLIDQAKAGNAHEALGYPSWTAYVSDRFGGALGKLKQAERQPLVLLLAEQGMSTRAIGSVVGANQSTVVRDLAGDADASPGPVTGTDPVSAFADEAEMRDILAMGDATPDEFESAITEARASGDMSRENVVAKVTAPKKVVGLDGKSYSRPVVQPAATAAKPHRPPLPKAYSDHAHKVLRNVESLSRLHQDDRFIGHRDNLQVGTLIAAADTLLDLLADLGVDRHKYGGAR